MEVEPPSKLQPHTTNQFMSPVATFVRDSVLVSLKRNVTTCPFKVDKDLGVSLCLSGPRDAKPKSEASSNGKTSKASFLVVFASGYGDKIVGHSSWDSFLWSLDFFLLSYEPKDRTCNVGTSVNLSF